MHKYVDNLVLVLWSIPENIKSKVKVILKTVRGIQAFDGLWTTLEEEELSCVTH